jgi:hypothetical protein
VQTQSLPPSASQEILNAQRLKRPSSPHFTIYQPQLTWISSIVNRATGGALSARMLPFLTSHLSIVQLTAFSPVRLFAGIPRGSGDVQQRTHYRVRCWAARLPEVHRQGSPGRTLLFPLLEWSATLELGHGEMYVASFSLNRCPLTWP